MKENIEIRIEKLSLRKYAATLGISHTSVAKAVKSGHIVNGYDSEVKKIIVSIANDEWGDGIMERAKAIKNNSLPDIKESLLNETLLSDKDLPQVRTDISFTEARRMKEIFNAEIARITAFKEQGLYVEKERVYLQLFEYAKQLRVSIQNIPDRIVDRVIISKSRYEAHQIMIEAINESLEQLTKPPTI